MAWLWKAKRLGCSQQLIVLASHGLPWCFALVSLHSSSSMWALRVHRVSTVTLKLNRSDQAILVFTYFVNLVSTFGAIAWMCIAYTHMWVDRPFWTPYPIWLVQIVYEGIESSRYLARWPTLQSTIPALWVLVCSYIDPDNHYIQGVWYIHTIYKGHFCDVSPLFFTRAVYGGSTVNT